MTTLRRPPPPPITKPPPPDLTDFMNDMFFGMVQSDPKSYDLCGVSQKNIKLWEDQEEGEGYDDSTPRGKSTIGASKMTQEWLDEARRIVASSSPGRHSSASVCDSPTSRFGRSPRFAAQGRLAQTGAALLSDRRDPLSRSARRHKPVEGFSGEILIKSAKHSRNKSETLEPSGELSPTTAVQKWFSTILKPAAAQLPATSSDSISTPLSTSPDPIFTNLPPRQSTHRKSRFQIDSPIPSRRTFRAEKAEARLLSSPSNNMTESPRRKSCLNLVESAHRRSISSNTCSVERYSSNVEEKESSRNVEPARDLNGFLKQQRVRIKRILDGEGSEKAKIVLSGTSNSTSSMLAAICYAWLLEKKVEKDENEVVVPVINVRRSRMWKLRQAAWLFHHVGIDTGALLFADEVDLENLMMSRKLNILVVGQDVLRSSWEIGSQCTILTDNYCEDAYDLLQTPELKKLLLAGILLDTQNLNASAISSMTRDAEAVLLLLVGSSPNYRNTLYDQLVQDQKDGSFLEVLRNNYGKHPSERTRDTGTTDESRVSVSRRSTSSLYNGTTKQYAEKDINDTRSDQPTKVSPQPAKMRPSTQARNTAPTTLAQDSADSGGRNKFSLAKWFGFGGK
ncbi:hypothetical protein QQ045_028611 [Rhodiola kirilowii]